MDKEMKNKVVELSDEEVVKVSGGLNTENQGTAYCDKCDHYYAYTDDGSGKVPPHNCASNNAATNKTPISMI